MTTKKNYLAILINVIAISLGYVISNLQVFGLCQDSYNFGTYIGCSDKIIETIGQPLLLYALIALPITLIAVLIAHQSYKTWKKFTLWWLFLSLIVILATPTSSNTWMPLYSLEREGVTWIMGILFALISLGIIAWKSLKKA